MNRQAWAIFVVVTLLVAGSAKFLYDFGARQALGRPGLKVVPQPVLTETGRLIGTNAIDLPARVLTYESTNVVISELEYNWLPKDTTYGRRIYRAPDGFEVWNSTILMGTDRTSIHKPEYCLTGFGFAIERSERTSIRIEKPHPYLLPVTKLITTRVAARTPAGSGEPLRGIYIYWFVDDRQLTADHKQRMWWLARDLVRTGCCSVGRMWLIWRFAARDRRRRRTNV